MSDCSLDNKKILVLGVGNILQSDDGVGVHAVEQMRDQMESDDVEIVDGGTAGLDLLGLIEGRRTLLIVDAVDGGQAPGTMYRFTLADIESSSLRMDSLHQLGLLETLRMARLVGQVPQNIVIIGIQPESVDLGMTLSPTVLARLPGIILQVKKEIEAAGNDKRKKNVNNN